MYLFRCVDVYRELRGENMKETEIGRKTDRDNETERETEFNNETMRPRGRQWVPVIKILSH
jgi:hypothetical protein